MKHLRSIWFIAALALLLAACNVADSPDPISEDDTPTTQASYPLDWPVSGKVISNINLRPSRVRNGMGIGAPFGSPVYAAYGGTVINSPTFAGRLVKIRHANGYVTSYRNISPLFVKRGARVRQGTLIGRVASPFNALTKPHLHFEVRLKGRVIDWDNRVPVGTKVKAKTVIPYPFPGLGAGPLLKQ